MFKNIKLTASLNLLAIFALILNLISPLLFILPSKVYARPAEPTVSSDIQLYYDETSHQLKIAIPTNSQSSSYQLTYKHLVNGHEITEGVVGSLANQGASESASIFLGTASRGVPVPHQLTSGNVIIDPENIQRSFVYTNNQLWYLDNNQFSLANSIELNTWYSLPNNDQIALRFTSLPAGSHHFSLTKLALTAAQKQTLGAFTDYVYDLTSDLTNQTFSFDLRFKAPQGIASLNDFRVTYLHNLSDLSSQLNLPNLDHVNLNNGYITVSNINHMTIFVVTTPQPVNQNCSNVTLVTQAGDICYNSIQAAITAAQPGETIKVAPGTYYESLVIDKPLTLESTAGYSQTNLISPTSTAITIQADNVTLDGFNIEITPQDASEKYGVVFTDHSHLTIKNNRFRNLISTGSHAYAIAAVSIHADVNGLKILNNRFYNLHGDQTSAAVALGWSSPQTHWFNSPLIRGNRIVKVTSDSRGAYGILINHQTQTPLIKGNIIKTLHGHWTHGIGLEGDTPQAQVLANHLDNFSVNNPVSVSAGIFVENNPSVGNGFNFHQNHFSMMNYGVINVVNLVNNSLIDATQNWWGASDGPYDPVADGLTNPNTNNGSGVGVWGMVDYSNWLTDGTAPQITFVQPTINSYHHGIIHLKATCNETCDYVNFWWRKSDETYSASSKRYHRLNTNGTNFEWDLNSLNAEKADGTTYSMSDGVYYLYVAGKDLAGNWSRTPEISITVDNTAPDTTFNVPTSITNGTFTLSGHATDNLHLNRVYVQLVNRDDNHRYGGTTINLIPQGNSADWSRNYNATTDNLPNGTYAAHVTVVDMAGNTYNSGWSQNFVIDNTPPSTQFTSPNNDIITNQPISILGTATDNIGVAQIDLFYQLFGGSNWTQLLTLTNFNNNSPFNFSYTWTPSQDGIYNLKAEATDLAGNQEQTAYATNLTYDTQTPTSSVSIQGDLAETQNIVGDAGWHGNGWYHHYDSVTFNIAPNGPAWDYVYYYLTSGDQSCPSIGNSNYHYLSNHTNIASWVNYYHQGLITLCYYAFDTAGNTENIVHKQLLKLDPNPPFYTILYNTVNGHNVNNIYYLNHSNLSIDINVGDTLSGYTRTRYDLYQANSQGQCQADSNLRFNGDAEGHYWKNDNLVPAMANTTRTLTRTGIPDGHYCLRIWDYDDVQNKAWTDTNGQQWLNFIVDTQAPSVTVNSQIINYSSPEITGTAQDDQGLDYVDVTINGETHRATLNSNGTWVISRDTFSSLPDGTYDVIATAADLAGNQTIDSTTDELQIDTVPPTATFTHAIDGQVLGANEIAYVQHISQLTFDGVYLDQIPSSNLKQDSFVIFDAQADGSFAFQNNSAQAYCSWRATQNTLPLSGVTDTLTAINFSLCVNSLNEGEYYMSHQVYDHATRWDIPSITQFRDVLGLHFFIDRTSPTVSATITPSNSDGDNGWYVTQPTITLTATDYVALDHLEYHWNSDSWSTYTQPLQPTEGDQTLYYRSVDKAGNYSTEKSMSVKFDQTKPGVPQNVQVSDITNTTAKITWQAATDNIGIDHYTVEWNLDGTSTTYNHTVDANTFEVTMDRLTPGLWHARVIALDAAGNNIAGGQDFTVTSPAQTNPTPTPTPQQPQALGLQTQLQPTPTPTPSASPTTTSSQTQTSGEVKGLSTQACSFLQHNLPWLLVIFQFIVSLLSLTFLAKSLKRRLLLVFLASLVWLSLWQLNQHQLICQLNHWPFATSGLVGVLTALF